jgi:hypothetical protein
VRLEEITAEKNKERHYTPLGAITVLPGFKNGLSWYSGKQSSKLTVPPKI